MVTAESETVPIRNNGPQSRYLLGLLAHGSRLSRQVILGEYSFVHSWWQESRTVAKQPFVEARPLSGMHHSLPRKRRISVPGLMVCALFAMAIIFSSCSAATIQSQGTRSYDAGHAYAANYAAKFRVSAYKFCRTHKTDCFGKDSGPLTYPASTPQKWCTILGSGETSFKSNPEDWVAGCVKAFKGARFVDPWGTSSGTIPIRLSNPPSTFTVENPST